MKRRQFMFGMGAGIASSMPMTAQACQCNTDSTAFSNFTRWSGCQAQFNGRIPEVYSAGSGPSVIILHEVTGADPAAFAFAYRVASRGFTVFVPVLFGSANHREENLYTALQLTKICMTREFTCFDSRRSSPVVDWVRQLGTAVFNEASAHDPTTRGIGVIGLCLTGNFALAMAADEHLLAPVVCEPALPFAVLAPADVRASLGLSDQELDALRGRLRGGMDIAAFRFTGDPLVPDERIATLENLVKASPAKLCGDVNLKPPCVNAHAVFTDDFDPSSTVSIGAFERLIGFLEAKIGQAAHSLPC